MIKILNECAKVKSYIFIPLAICTLGSVAACSTVNTTAKAPVQSGSIAYSMAGKTLPLVVFQSGHGDGKDSWAPIFTKIAESNKVFAYDRPGYGDSPVMSSPRDPCEITEELRNVLRAAGAEPPYILVGHSLGGLYQFVYAKLYPGEVAGLVLLDPTHPDHWIRMQQDAPIAAAVLKTLHATIFTSTMRREFDDMNNCLEQLDMSTPLDKPVRILTKTKFELLELGAFETMVHALEDDWRRLSGTSMIKHVAGSGHYIHQDRPDVVIREINSLVSETQNGTP